MLGTFCFTKQKLKGTQQRKERDKSGEILLHILLLKHQTSGGTQSSKVKLKAILSKNS